MQRKTYYFNDGMGGVVVARNLNQAIKILAGKFGHTKKEKAEYRKEIKKSIKEYFKNDDIDVEWVVESYPTNEKTSFLGWTE